jgi:diguanylate cyclase (GGDEF)-like protein
MVRVREVIPILDRLIEELEIDTNPVLIGTGVFFVVVNKEELIYRFFGEGNDLAGIDISRLGRELEEDESKFSTLNFSVDLGMNSGFELQLGVFRHQSKGIVKMDEAFLWGIKQSIILTLNHLITSYQNELLFGVSKKLHSSIEVDQVLQVVFESTQDLFPDYDAQIWLSYDYDQKLPVKKLSFQGIGMDQNTKAFVMGETMLYEVHSRKAISAPMKGKQGVYGVLQFISARKNKNVELDIAHISILAETAGNALENANLYKQSQRLISQLQLINETSEQLSKSLNLESNIEFMLSKLTSTFGPNAVHFLEYVKEKNMYKMVSSTHGDLRDKLISIMPGTLIQVVHLSKEPFIATDMRSEDQGIFFKNDEELTVRSIMIVPMLYEQNIRGMVIITHPEPNQFNFENYRLLQTLVHHASFAFVNSTLHEEVNRMVITDNLTRLFSRSYLEQMIVQSLSSDKRGAFILIDIDNFKNINDTYGHQVGDDILIQIANIMKASIREGDIAARWGGEELAIYLPDVPINVGVQIAERIRQAIERESSPHVTISCGVSFWQQKDSEKTMKKLFQKADRALYQAKGAGKNEVILAT